MSSSIDRLIVEAVRVVGRGMVKEAKKEPTGLEFSEKFPSEKKYDDYLKNQKSVGTIKTGVNDGSMAKEIEVFHWNGYTVLEYSGEAYNQDAWVYKGTNHSLDDIKAWYLANFED